MSETFARHGYSVNIVPCCDQNRLSWTNERKIMREGNESNTCLIDRMDVSVSRLLILFLHEIILNTFFPLCRFLGLYALS